MGDLEQKRELEIEFGLKHSELSPSPGSCAVEESKSTESTDDVGVVKGKRESGNDQNAIDRGGVRWLPRFSMPDLYANFDYSKNDGAASEKYK